MSIQDVSVRTATPMWPTLIPTRGVAMLVNGFGRRFFCPILVALFLVGATAVPAFADVTIDFGRGPVTVHVPPGYDPAEPAPLLMFLHGYGPGVTGEGHAEFVGIPEWADRVGFLSVYPDGTADSDGLLFWNATDACCDFDGSDIDDSGYLRDLIEAIIDELAVDSDRVFVIGASAGVFMAHRLACDHADLIAAVASVAGATWADPTMCAPSEAIRILQIHGSEDVNVDFGGGALDGVAYPGAVETIEMWAELNGCSTEPDLSSPPLDLDKAVPGFETTVARYNNGCDAGGEAQLRTIVGGTHATDLTPDAVPLLLDFFLWGGGGEGLLVNRSFIPAAAYAAGAEGAFFQTDIDVRNSGDTSERYRLLWLPRGESADEPLASAELRLDPKACARHVNAVSEIFGLAPGAVGAIVVEASSPNVPFNSRTYSTAPDGDQGTFGQAIPAVPEREVIPAGERRFLLFATEDDRYRTNIGCINTGYKGAFLTVELFGDQGVLQQTVPMILFPWVSDQLNRPLADFRPVRGSVEVSAFGSRVFCYGSVIDNSTNDPTTMLPQRGGF